MEKYKQKDFLIEHFVNQNKSKSQIAKELNVSVDTVYSYIKNFSLKKKYDDPDTLTKLYINDNLTIEEIAASLKTTYGVIQARLKKFLISRETPQYHDSQWLKTKFIDEELSIQDIAVLCRVEPYNISYNLRRYNIHKEDAKYKDKDWLQSEYCELGKSIASIALEQSASEVSIRKMLKEFNLSRTKEQKALAKDIKKNKVIGSKIKTGTFNELIGGKTIKELSDEYNIPYATMLRNSSGKDEDGLRSYIEGYRCKKTDIEIVMENELGLKVYDKFFDKDLYPKLNYKPDFKLTDSLALNLDGLYWHSELEKNPEYHFDMRNSYEQLGLSILQFRADEIFFKKDIVLSMIENRLLKIKNKIYGRKTVINPVTHSEADTFLNDNHLMGSIKAKHIGLYNDDKLVSILSYKIKSDTLKIERFCSLKRIVVIGALSKLISFLEEKYKPARVESWVDLRYGDGKSLEKLGFVKDRDTLGWKWTNKIRTFNRLKCRANMDSRMLSEKEYAEELGWIRIYDAGQRLYIKK